MPPTIQRTLRERRDDFTRAVIVEAIDTYPTLRAAAQSLGLTPANMYCYMRRLGIPSPAADLHAA
jgi:transcriptional regulator with GAF, ATPase, and Fis domain